MPASGPCPWVRRRRWQAPAERGLRHGPEGCWWFDREVWVAGASRDRRGSSPGPGWVAMPAAWRRGPETRTARP